MKTAEIKYAVEQGIAEEEALKKGSRGLLPEILQAIAGNIEGSRSLCCAC
jgi:hypothetical protein